MTQEHGPVPGRSLVVGKHRPALDGLRGVGMVTVLTYHAGLAITPGSYILLSQFFTLSGFLITGIIIDGLSRDRFSLREFWYRRFRRLMPAALAALALVVVFGVTVSTRQQAEDLPGSIAAAAGYVANWYFIIKETSYVDLFAAPNPVQHFWSLALEEQAYLIMPIVLLGLWRATRSLRTMAWAYVVGIVASTAWMYHLHRVGAGIDRIYYGTDTRMAEILVGGVLAIVLYRAPRISVRTMTVVGWLGVAAYALILASVFNFHLDDDFNWDGKILGFAILSAFTIAAIVSEHGPLARILSIDPLPQFGRITYGVYLYHWPIFLWLDPERTGLDGWALFVLRSGVTIAIAIASYHLLEMPIRDGRWRLPTGWLRVAVGPAVAVSIVVAGLSLVDAEQRPDPFVTIRADDEPPITPHDGVLDMVVITDAEGSAVADGIEAAASDRDDLSVTRAAPFRCDELVGELGERTCANWAREWPGLIADHDPDVVLLYLTEWPDDAVTATVGDDLEAQTALFTEVLSNSVGMLTQQGAPLVWSPSGNDTLGLPYVLPVGRAMRAVELGRTDVRRLVLRMPATSDHASDEYLDEATRTLVFDAFLYQRTDRENTTRMLVIGDSQARSIGYGLEIWGAERGDVHVWNIATEGCGLIDEGEIELPPTPIPEQCLQAVAALPGQVESFDPDIVVVLTSGRDIQVRTHASWDGVRTIGDPAVDAFLLAEYSDLVDTLSRRGAAIVWMRAPCGPVPFQDGDSVRDADRELRLLNTNVLEPLAASRPEIDQLFPLDEVLCPDGEFTEDIDGIENIRFDGLHFTPEGSIWFADTYGEAILAAG